MYNAYYIIGFEFHHQGWVVVNILHSTLYITRACDNKMFVSIIFVKLNSINVDRVKNEKNIQILYNTGFDMPHSDVNDNVWTRGWRA